MAAGVLSGVTDLGVHCVSCEPNTNQAQRDPMVTCPIELVAECFRRLDLRDCIAVSHVSCAWRTAALADCWMWNEYELDQRPPGIDIAIECLSTLLSRSQAAPFYLTCYLSVTNFTDALYDLLDAHLHRKAVLDFVGGVRMSRLLRHRTDAPLLEALVYYSDDEFGQHMFPAGWGARNAPRLQYLTAAEFSLPSDTAPFKSLHTLCAHWISPRAPRDFSFARVFPKLQLLELRGLTPAHIAMLTPLPPALESVMMSPASREAIDYSPLFRTSSTPCRIRKLHVSEALGFHDALALFARAWAGPWKMVLDVYSIKLRSDACDAHPYWHIMSERPISLRSERVFAAHLAQLTALEMPFASFADLHSIRAPVWNRALPSLRTLVLVFPTSYKMDADEWRAILRDADGVLRDPQAGILMPALECMEIHIPNGFHGIRGFLKWLEHDAPVVLPYLFSNGGSRMACIGLTTNTPHEISHANVGPLLHLAERVTVVGSAPAELVFERSTST